MIIYIYTIIIYTENVNIQLVCVGLAQAYPNHKWVGLSIARMGMMCYLGMICWLEVILSGLPMGGRPCISYLSNIHSIICWQKLSKSVLKRK